MARSAGRATFRLPATSSTALRKQADQPAANNCSGFVPVVALPGVESFTSRRPSELRDAPSRPPVVCVFAVYRTLLTWDIAISFRVTDGFWQLKSARRYRRSLRTLQLAIWIGNELMLGR